MQGMSHSDPFNIRILSKWKKSMYVSYSKYGVFIIQPRVWKMKIFFLANDVSKRILIGFFCRTSIQKRLAEARSSVENLYFFLVFDICLFILSVSCFFKLPSLQSSVKVVFCCCLVIKKNHRDAGLPYWRDQLYFFHEKSPTFNSHLAEFETLIKERKVRRWLLA